MSTLQEQILEVQREILKHQGEVPEVQEKEVEDQQAEQQAEDEKEEVEEEGIEKYSNYSEADQYSSDSDFEVKKKHKQPFEQIQVDYQHIQPMAFLPAESQQPTQEEIEQNKIAAYQEWNRKAEEQQREDKIKEENWHKQIEERIKETEEKEQQQEVLQIQTALTTQIEGGYIVNQEELMKLIYPWSVHFDAHWKKNYYSNSITNESVWELPADIIRRVQEFRRQFEHRLHDYEDRNMFKFLPRQYIAQQRYIIQQKRQKGILRPARKQVEESLATKYSYKQGDEEYNIWYDKFLSDGNKFKDKEASHTRCDPELDIGYTKADLYEKFSSYYCLHFSRGSCSEGVNCRYYHRIPTLEEGNQIDNAKDAFGRSRYSTHREDMAGIGAFSKDTRSIYVTSYKMPSAATHTQALAQMYEIIWRHFSVWGDIEDINVIVTKGVSFVRYRHRCQAEFAKEAMENQALEQQEILIIKWANDDPNPKAISRETEEQKLRLIAAVKDKEKRQNMQDQQKYSNRTKINGTMVNSRDRSENDRKYKGGGGHGRIDNRGGRGGDRGGDRGGNRGGDSRGGRRGGKRGGGRGFHNDSD